MNDSNWFDSTLKTVSKTATNVGENISKSTSKLVDTVQGWLPFSDEETLAFFAVLFAVAAADGDISEDELSMIMSSPRIAQLSDEGKKKLQSYSYDPPVLKDAIQNLSSANQELKFGLIFYILNLVWIDGTMSLGEAEAIKVAQQEFEINDVQINIIKDFIDVLAKAQDEQNQETREEIKAILERMEKVGIPISALAHSQHDAEDMEYSDKKFVKKMQAFGLQAGKGLIEQVFVLWNVLHDPDTPTKHKLIIGGALAYWILPIDMIPDVLPVVGFSDDLPVIATALTGVAMSVTPEIQAKAKQQTEALFGGNNVVLEGEVIDVKSKESH